MIACSERMEPSPWVDLPGPPYDTMECPVCRGFGAHISLHPLYARTGPCTDCYGSGEVLIESNGDER